MLNKNQITMIFLEIQKIYPRFESSPALMDTWQAYIGKYEYEDVMKVLKNHVEGEKGDYTPTLSMFARALRNQRKTELMMAEDVKPHFYRISKGNITYEDENGYEYGNPECIPYYYDKSRNICRKDRNGREIVIIPERMVMEL